MSEEIREEMKKAESMKKKKKDSPKKEVLEETIKK